MMSGSKNHQVGNFTPPHSSTRPFLSNHFPIQGGCTNQISKERYTDSTCLKIWSIWALLILLQEQRRSMNQNGKSSRSGIWDNDCDHPFLIPSFLIPSVFLLHEYFTIIVLPSGQMGASSPSSPMQNGKFSSFFVSTIIPNIYGSLNHCADSSIGLDSSVGNVVSLLVFPPQIRCQNSPGNPLFAAISFVHRI